jgi:hypothetical protein
MSLPSPEKETADCGRNSEAGQMIPEKLTAEDSAPVNKLRGLIPVLVPIEDHLTELAFSDPDEFGELLRCAVVLRRGRRLLSDFIGGRK